MLKRTEEVEKLKLRLRQLDALHTHGLGWVGPAVTRCPPVTHTHPSFPQKENVSPPSAESPARTHRTALAGLFPFQVPAERWRQIKQLHRWANRAAPASLRNGAWSSLLVWLPNVYK